MKKVVTFLLHAALLFTGPLFSQSSTPNIGLFKPAIGTPNWGPYINGNSDKIDAAIGTLQNPFQGAWVSTTVYARGQFVSYNGATYISLQNNNLNQNPATATTYWYVIASPSIVPPPGAAGTAPVSNGTAYISTGVVLTSQINAANGVAGLDGSAKLATTQLALPGGTTNFLRADGTWAAPPNPTGFATLNSNNFAAGSTQTLLSNNTTLVGNDPLLIQTLTTNQAATIGFQEGGSGGPKWQIGKGLTNDFAIKEYVNNNQVIDITIGASATADVVTLNGLLSAQQGISTSDISASGTIGGAAFTGTSATFTGGLTAGAIHGTTGTFTGATSVGGLTVSPGNITAGPITGSSLGLTASLTGTTATFSGAVSAASLAATGAVTGVTSNFGSGKFSTSATAITETVPVTVNTGSTQLAQSFTSSNASGTQVSLGGTATGVNNWLMATNATGGLSFTNAATGAAMLLTSTGSLHPTDINTTGNIVASGGITASNVISSSLGVTAFSQGVQLAGTGTGVFGVCLGSTGTCIGADPASYNGIAVDQTNFPNRLEIHSVSEFTFFSGGNDVMDIDGGSGQVTLIAPLNFNGSQHVIPVTGGSTVPTYTFPVTISGIVYYLPLLPAAP